MSNAGGAWDNAKKQIEEARDLVKNTAKGSEPHKARWSATLSATR